MSDNRDTVANNTGDKLVAGQGLTGLAYNDRPFNVVKGIHDVAGFSATSHYRISQLAQELFDEDAALTSALANETASREDAINTLTSALANETSSREAAVNVLTSDLNTKETALNGDITDQFNARSTAIAGVSNALNSAISTHVNVSNAIDAELAALEGRVVTFENTQGPQLRTDYDNLSNALVAETNARTTAVADETASREAAIAAVDALIDQEVLDRDDAYSTISNAVDTNVNTLVSQIEGISNAFQSALGAEALARETQDNVLQGNIDTVSNALNTATADLQGQVDNITSNTDPAALDSLTEILGAFQAADTSITNTLQGMVTSANANNASHDERLDYLEKFCTMASSFLHMMHSDGTTNTAFTFPPVNENKAIYDGIDINYDQTNVYTHLTNAAGYEAITL